MAVTSNISLMGASLNKSRGSLCRFGLAASLCWGHDRQPVILFKPQRNDKPWLQNTALKILIVLFIVLVFASHLKIMKGKRFWPIWLFLIALLCPLWKWGKIIFSSSKWWIMTLNGFKGSTLYLSIINHLFHIRNHCSRTLPPRNLSLVHHGACCLLYLCNRLLHW